MGEAVPCLAWYRLHVAVVGEPEGINDRGIKGIFGELVACLAWFKLHAAVVGGRGKRVSTDKHRGVSIREKSPSLAGP